MVQRATPTYIDLTSTDDDVSEDPRDKPSGLPFRSASTVTSRPVPERKKYVPVDNKQFASYATTYATSNFHQKRKYGSTNS